MVEKQELLEFLDKQIDMVERMINDFPNNQYIPKAREDIKKFERLKKIVEKALSFLDSGLPQKMNELNERAEAGREDAENRWDESYWRGYKDALAEIYEHVNPVRSDIKNNKLLGGVE